MPTTCIAMSWARFLKSSVRATKSVSQFSSTKSADAAAGVDVALDQALARLALRALGGLGGAPLLEQRDGAVRDRRRFLEGALALHHAGAGALAERLYVFCGDSAVTHRRGRWRKVPTRRRTRPAIHSRAWRGLRGRRRRPWR